MKNPIDPLTPRPLDFSKGVRGKYFDRMQEGTNIVLIAPDLLETFPDSESVNEALRSLKKIADRSARTTAAQNNVCSPLKATRKNSL
jgi:hypothetical protein